MVQTKGKVRRRDVALSSVQIVSGAVDILDRDEEAGLTFKTLAAKLAPAPGRSTGISPVRVN